MKNKRNIFLISLLVGFIFELIMANFWKYDSLPYFLGVPIPIVFVWVALLPFGYYLLEKYEKKTKIPFWLDLLILYTPFIILTEFIGTNVLGWQINKIYPAIIGNFMKAPISIYIAYYFIALFIYKKFFKTI